VVAEAAVASCRRWVSFWASGDAVAQAWAAVDATVPLARNSVLMDSSSALRSHLYLRRLKDEIEASRSIDGMMTRAAVVVAAAEVVFSLSRFRSVEDT